jgi:putative endonuclease
MQPAVYLLTNRQNGTLYTGVTSHLIQRIWQHREGTIKGFTQRYRIKILVWYELHSTMEHAIRREKAIKEWKRHWKVELIESMNPAWRDLYEDIIGFRLSPE